MLGEKSDIRLFFLLAIVKNINSLDRKSWYLCSTSESCQKSSMVTQRDAKGENTDAREVDYVRVVQVKHFLSCCRATTHRSLGTEPCHRPFPVVYRCVGAARPRDVRPPFRPALRLLASNSSSYTFALWRSIFSLSFHRTLVFFLFFRQTIYRSPKHHWPTSQM